MYLFLSSVGLDATRMLLSFGLLNSRFLGDADSNQPGGKMHALREFMRLLDTNRQRHEELARKFAKRKLEVLKVQEPEGTDFNEGDELDPKRLTTQTILLQTRWKTFPKLAFVKSLDWIKDNARVPLGDRLRSLSTHLSAEPLPLPISAQVVRTIANAVGKEDDSVRRKARDVWVQHYRLQELKKSPKVRNGGHCLYHGVWGGDEYVPNGEGVAELLDGPLHLDALLCNSLTKTQICSDTELVSKCGNLRGHR